ncbi:hypothetical protein [Nonomuraea fuscirosea]|uniref:hypothetical protein n=1 Tax=Nonomuraea fuscirosea TaxID=1291556 RepID=UPI00342F1F03
MPAVFSASTEAIYIPSETERGTIKGFVMARKLRGLTRAGSVLGVAGAVVVGASGPALAIPPDVVVVRIQSQGEIGASTGFYESFNTFRFEHPAVVRVVGYFRDHTSTRVTLTKIKVCYTNAVNREVLIAPAIMNSSGSFNKDWITNGYAPRQCREYPYTRTLTRQSDGNMMQVLIRIVCRDNSRASTIVGFNR